MTTKATKRNLAWLAAALLLAGASVGPAEALPIDTGPRAATAPIPVQFYGPYYRPYWRYRRPYWRRPFFRRPYYYGYGSRRKSPNYFCNNQPSRCF